MKDSGGIAVVVAALLLHGCVPPEIILPGDISGTVSDAESNQPVQQALVMLSPTNDTTFSGTDGSYLLNNLEKGNFEIQASKRGYIPAKQNVTVLSASTANVDLILEGAQEALYSVDTIDFGIDTTVQKFTISNNGSGTLRYSLFPTEGWIDLEPSEGEVTTGSDTITVTIDRTGLLGSRQVESVNVRYYVGEDPHEDPIGIYVNGVFGQLKEQYYHVVRIGTQVWLAENLNTGQVIAPWNLDNRTSNDKVIERYCYDDSEANCDIYGGLYSWLEMMDYHAQDTGVIGTTQGICPAGWHLPTFQEWETLFDYLGGRSAAGGRMKDTGTIEEGTGYWKSPNEGANNESGFTALPGGNVDYIINELVGLGEIAAFWTTGRNEEEIVSGCWFINYDASGITPHSDPDGANSVNSVRCIRDP